MSQYAKTYNSFSGIDITPMFGGNALGECQGISYSVSREKAPLYTLGSPNPRSFSRGKRGIAGAVVFLVFDRSALFESMSDNNKFWGNTWEEPLAKSTGGANFTGLQTANTINPAGAQSVTGVPAGTAGPVGQSSISTKKVRNAEYHDQLPPFDILLFAATERGHGAIMEILGVEILNCGSGVSVDDITTDESCTWVGINVIPWHSQTYDDPNPSTGTERGTSGYTYDKAGL